MQQLNHLSTAWQGINSNGNYRSSYENTSSIRVAGITIDLLLLLLPPSKLM
jgi:hypothetical protein